MPPIYRSPLVVRGSDSTASVEELKPPNTAFRLGLSAGRVAECSSRLSEAFFRSFSETASLLIAEFRAHPKLFIAAVSQLISQGSARERLKLLGGLALTLRDGQLSQLRPTLGVVAAHSLEYFLLERGKHSQADLLAERLLLRMLPFAAGTKSGRALVDNYLIGHAKKWEKLMRSIATTEGEPPRKLTEAALRWLIKNIEKKLASENKADRLAALKIGFTILRAKELVRSETRSKALQRNLMGPFNELSATKRLEVLDSAATESVRRSAGKSALDRVLAGESLRLIVELPGKTAACKAAELFFNQARLALYNAGMRGAAIYNRPLQKFFAAHGLKGREFLDLLPDFGLWSGAWTNCCEEDYRAQVVAGSIRTIAKLDRNSPGTAQFLREVSGLRIFSRYPLSLLREQAELLRQGKAAARERGPCFAVFNPVCDWNGAFISGADVKKLYKESRALKHPLPVIVTESSTPRGLLRQQLRIVNYFGPIRYALIDGHGSPEFFDLDVDVEVSASQIASKRIGKLLRRIYAPEAQIVFGPCEGGVLGGVAYTAAAHLKRMGITIMSQKTASFLETLELHSGRQGRVKVLAEYARDPGSRRTATAVIVT